MKEISGVYEIRNKLNNHRYVGSSCCIERRFKHHKYQLWRNRHRSIYLQRAWNKYGEQQFEFNILETCEPIKDSILFLEQKYLDLKPEYNICTVANSTLGFKHSKKTKKKLSEWRTGKTGLCHHTSEYKLYMSDLMKNRIVSEQTKSKLRKPILMLNMLTGEVIREFKSMGEAGLFVGHYNRRVEIKKAAQGKRKTAYGYKWKYKVV